MTSAHQHIYGGLAADLHGGVDDGRPPLVFLHGLTYNRRQWDAVRAELPAGRRVLALDLPGHGDSPGRDTYDLDAVAATVHQAVTETGLDAPVVVGHSIGGVLATIYAASYPARGVVNVDQPLLAGPFADMLRTAEPVLRSPAYLQIWERLTAGMGIDQLPPTAQDLVRNASTPRQDLFLGYWDELLSRPAEGLRERREHDLTTLDAQGVPYRHVSSQELPPAYRAWLHSVLPDADLTVLASVSHFPHLSHPSELAALL
ncbi:alpha/beta hydrolase [Streptomyces sp. NPDC005708]|uniref:alpha/beta fold hydrolase n=1 Tax=Streptomyces sp. NPDC005708 TaxID=3154564 RepID=UPI003400D3E2